MLERALGLALAVVAVGCDGPNRPEPMDLPDGGPGSICMGCTAVPIGTPIWEVRELMVLVVPVGDAVDASPFVTSLDRIFMPGHAFSLDNLLVGPAMAHAGPYAGELDRLAAASGFERTQQVSAWDYSAPGGIMVAWLAAPGPSAPMGSSFDFPSGPIVPNSTFPIHVDGDVTRNGAPYDSMFDSDYPGYDFFMPPIAVDGPSHWFFVAGENASFAPPGTPNEGDYVFTATMTDTTGAGWTVTIPYTVTPPPNPGCDDMGEHRNFDEALPLEMGTIEGKVCDFGDMYLIGGTGERTVTLRSDPSMGNLEMAVFAGTPDHTMLRRTMDIASREEITAAAGDFVQVFGEAPAMMGPYLIGVQ